MNEKKEEGEGQIDETFKIEATTIFKKRSFPSNDFCLSVFDTFSCRK